MSRVARGVSTLLWVLLIPVVTMSIWAQVTLVSSPDAVLAVMPKQSTALRASLGSPPGPSGSKPIADDRKIELAHQLLEASPLDFTPLVVSAQFDSSVDRKTALGEALRRNPRSIPARIQAAQDAADSGNLQQAFLELGRIHAIAPGETELVVQAGAILVQAEGGVAALKSNVVAGENWAGDLLRRLNNSDFDIDKLLPLNQVNPAAAGDYIRRVLSERGVEAGFVAWFSMLPAAEVLEFSWPYDPKFEHKAAPTPFNWEVARLETEFLADGGLFATYDGRGSPKLAVQAVVLDAGRYVLTVEMHGDTQDRGGSFKWVVACFPDGAPLASLVVGSLSEKTSFHDLAFEVPATGCRGQQLGLYGAPGEFPTRARSVSVRARIARSGESG
jgi:hypothetical protein